MPVFFRFAWATLSAALLAFLISACDSGPGTASLEEDQPVLSDFTFDPKVVATTDSDDDTFTFPVTMRVAVNSNGSMLEQVAYLVRSPGAGRPPVAQGTLDPADGQYYEKTVEVSVPRGDVGLYTVLVYAVGEGGNLSNDVRGNLRFLGIGEPPVIDGVIAPESVSRPTGHATTRITLVAVVRDPDGLSNINTVQFWNYGNPQTRFEMFDDGADGDEEPGDGNYSRTIQISSENSLGVTRLRFQAIDKTGLESTVVETSIAVVE